MLLQAGSTQPAGDETYATCSELKAASATTDLKLDKVISTLENHAGRIEALEACQRQAERYLCKVKPCTELIIIGIPSALASTTDQDAPGVCAAVLKLVGADNYIADVNEVRWLPLSARLADGQPDTSDARSMVMQFKQIVFRDSVLRLKKRSGELPASALLPGAAGSLRLYEIHSNFVHDLLRKARTTASARGYCHVWARDGVVCVRKSDGSDVIELLTESDLESLL
ncbi:hypothetical protein TKK_0018642 [Trichogramma kaykai]